MWCGRATWNARKREGNGKKRNGRVNERDDGKGVKLVEVRRLLDGRNDEKGNSRRR